MQWMDTLQAIQPGGGGNVPRPSDPGSGAGNRPFAPGLMSGNHPGPSAGAMKMTIEQKPVAPVPMSTPEAPGGSSMTTSPPGAQGPGSGGSQPIWSPQMQAQILQNLMQSIMARSQARDPGAAMSPGMGPFAQALRERQSIRY